jgi:serine/threonine protein kinase
MGERTDKTEKFNKAKVLFENLAFSDWKIDESFKSDGGQAIVLGVTNSSGQKGVFRYLEAQDETSKKRFYREINILTDPRFKHKNIVNILEYTRDEQYQWYISERGNSFKSFWNQQQQILSEKPHELVEFAIGTIKQVCGGLIALHKNGIVHRDIKPGNLVVSVKEAEINSVLIDFGVSHNNYDEERITKVNEAVGNNRYSPDVMMNRMDEVVPWLDIFQLAQLLIWMVQISPVKNWTRPLDWRWVNYDDRLPDNIIRYLRAITAQCSEQKISPQNAEELLGLLNRMFPPKYNLLKEPKVDINIESIESGITAGEANRSINLAERSKLIEASYPTAKIFYNELRKGLEEIVAALQKHSVSFQKEERSLEEFYKTLLTNYTPSQTLYTLLLKKRTYFLSTGQKFDI